MERQKETRSKLAEEILPPMLDGIAEKTEELVKEGLEDRLERLGLKSAGQTVDRIKKMQRAYARYGYIPPEKIRDFNEKLYKETIEEDDRARNYKKLIFTPLDRFNRVPPDHVLIAIDKAQKDEIFDRFEVAHIDWIQEIKDPIVFGRIDGCNDRFFIAQWDDDVTIEELLGIG